MRRSLIAHLERLERKLKPDRGFVIIVLEADHSGPVRFVGGGRE